MQGHYPFAQDCAAEIIDIVDDGYHENATQKWMIALLVFILPLFLSCFIGCFLAAHVARKYEQRMKDESDDDAEYSSEEITYTYSD